MSTLLIVLASLYAGCIVADNGEWVITDGYTGPPVVAWDDPDEIPPEKLDIPDTAVTPPPADTITPDYFVVFTQPKCRPCREVEQTVIPVLEASGYTVIRVDPRFQPQWGVTVTPTIWRANNATQRQAWRQGAVIPAATLLASVERPVTSAVVAPVTPIPRPVTVRERLPVVPTPWGIIDLETYSRNCNCNMCQGIRALQQQYRQRRDSVVVPQAAVTVPQAAAVVDELPQYAPTPVATVQHMLTLMDLDEDDVLVDLGCGNGSVLLAAVRHSDCKCIGVEIDPDKAEEARRNVEKAGLSHMITIITGDVMDFIPADHGVTAAVAYLYPDLLEKLSPALQQIAVVATPYHSVPGLPMKQFGDVWIYNRDAVNSIAGEVITVTPPGGGETVKLKRTSNSQRFQLVP